MTVTSTLISTFRDHSFHLYVKILYSLKLQCLTNHKYCLTNHKNLHQHCGRAVILYGGRFSL